jgi:hypothetical protein
MISKKEKVALKLVLDLARKFCFARYWDSLEKKGKGKETSKEESDAIELVAKMVGSETDDQESEVPR